MAEVRADVYVLREGVRILRAAPGEIRLRKGVWSFNEAVLNLAGQEEGEAQLLGAVAEALLVGGEADLAAQAAALRSDAEVVARCRKVLDQLKAQQFLADAAQREIVARVTALLGGNLSGIDAFVGTPRPVLFFADTRYARDAAVAIARDVGLPLDVIDDDTLAAIAAADLTTRTDAVAVFKAEERLRPLLSGYAAVLGCIASPHLTLLRNLNRLLVAQEMPLILGLVDGPFVTLLSALATQSGCFECYEQRMLARLEDTALYQEYSKASHAARPGGRTAFSPALHVLAGAVLAEGFLYSSLGMLRLAGRIVNVYLPLLEIQVQDLLRVPYCPACGFIAAGQMKEMYASSRRLVSELVANVELTD